MLAIVFITRGDEHKVEVLSRIALPVAILVHSVTAWIFGLEIARAWYSAIMAPIFVASACDSGLALLLVTLAILEKRGVFTTGDELFKSLAGLLATFIAVDAFFIGCEILTMAYPGAGEADALALMTSGPTAPFFWFEIIGGLLVPFLILVFSKNREKRGLVLVASALVILGVFCKRVWLLFTSFIVPNVYGAYGIPGASATERAADGMNAFSTIGTYAPTAVEIVVVVGVIALGALAWLVLSDKLIGKVSKTDD